MNISKILSISLIILMALSAVVIIAIFIGGTIGADEPRYLNYALYWAKILLVLTAGVAVLAQVYQLIYISGNLLKTLIIIVIFAILVIVSYTFSSNEILNLVGYTGKDNVPKVLKLTDMGLILMYIFFGFAVLSIVLSEVLSPLKK